MTPSLRCTPWNISLVDWVKQALVPKGPDTGSQDFGPLRVRFVLATTGNLRFLV